jgi:hypothetical protein
VKQLVFIAVVLFSLAIGAETAPESHPHPTGLEVADASTVPVVIENLDPEAVKRGLSPEIIEARVNAVLRRSGLKPVDAVRGGDYFYYVQIGVTAGGSVGISVSFQRAVVYNDGSTDRRIFARTWTNWTFAIDKSGTDKILSKVSELTEMFANEFLKANRK